MRRRPNPDDAALLARLHLNVRNDGRHRVGDGRTADCFSVEVRLGNDQIGSFLFGRFGTVMEAVDVYVDREYRRRGVASWVYREIGKRFSTEVKHSKIQKEDGRAFAAGRRHNPPKDIDSPKALGDECAVWAIAAATGAPVPDVRRAFMDAGEDIWKKRGGQGSGSSMRQIRAVIKKLDWDHKIVGVGASEMFGNGPRARFADMQSRLFLSGRWEGQIGADQFDLPDQLKEEAARYGTSRAALKATDDMVTVGQLVDQARKDGLALLAVTVNATRARVSAHIVGYSPSRGLYDTSVPTRAAKAAFIHGKADETITGLEWFAHGEDIPGRARRAVLWVFFKGE